MARLINSPQTGAFCLTNLPILECSPPVMFTG